MLKKELTLKDGIALSIGSIMGSGILFLPSLTTKIAGFDALLSWGLSVALCLPLLFLFSDMLKAVPNESGLKGFIALGLGEKWGNSVPVLLLGTVCLGMPAAAIIACEYLAKHVGLNHNQTLFAAWIFITVSFVPTLLGARLGGKIQQVVAIALTLVALGLFALTFPAAYPKLNEISFRFDFSLILQAAVVCFWAFAGFENMTFLAGEFKNPKKDILTSISVALFSCGSIYLLVGLNYAALVDHSSIDSSAGLYQLSEMVGGQLPLVITVFALVCVFINYISWTWGISRMMYAAAEGKKGLHFLRALDQNASPRNALIFLWLLFSISVVVNYLFPGVFESLLKIVSANFVVLYILAGLSYVRFSQTAAKKSIGVVIAAALLFVLLSDPKLIVYPSLLIAVSIAFSLLGEKKPIQEES